MARVSRPWRLTQQCAERGAADPRGPAWRFFQVRFFLLDMEFLRPPPPLVTPAFVLFLTFLTQFLPRLA
jgi:hypothetical protein